MLKSQKIIPSLFVVFFILLVLGGYFLWWPEYQKFQSKKLELEAKDQEIREKQSYLSELQSFSDKLSQYSEELSKIDSALPSESSPAALFSYIQKVSLENGLILEDINIAGLYSSKEADALPERVQKMPFSISINGTYPSFKNFLSIIYASSRIIEVKSISFYYPEEEGGNLFSFDLELETNGYNPSVSQ